MKIIAYYLPQFHEILENNEWWGQGFTEWTNIKKSKKLYKNHEQPVIPLDSNYYNLLDKKTFEWQAKLSNDFGIYGFCFYHYWFHGKMLLEKPVEKLLEWKEINQKFCFCWANHSWKRTWNGTNEVLQEQSYGNEEEWLSHFEYLKEYFLDERYIKIENKPVFMIYNCKDILELDKRVEFYNKKCKEIGFAGIYFIESMTTTAMKEVSKISQAIVLREPNIGLGEVLKTPKLRILNKLKRGFKYNFLLKPLKLNFMDFKNKSLEYAKNYKSSKKIFLGTFTAWDSTPRHGRRGFVIENNPENFKIYLEEQKKLMLKMKSDYIFLNAWNEWAEGMYLEPDKKNGYQYLEVIKKILDKK